jgi:hypothetical protein
MPQESRGAAAEGQMKSLGEKPATVQAEAAAAETKTKESKIMEVALVAVVEAAAMPQESRGAAAEGQMKSLSPL